MVEERRAITLALRAPTNCLSSSGRLQRANASRSDSASECVCRCDSVLKLKLFSDDELHPALLPNGKIWSDMYVFSRTVTRLSHGPRSILYELKLAVQSKVAVA